jgi:hypothetical protein
MYKKQAAEQAQATGQQAQGGPAPGGEKQPEAGKSDDDAVDADFEVVDEGDKK